MKLLLFLKLLVVAAVYATFPTVAEAKIEVCSPANTNIEIDGQVPGVISTPEFPDGYPGSSCIWIIQAPDNFRLQITIEVLRLQGADDHLVIRDGASQFTPLVGKYGPCASGSVILFSSGSSAFLQTVSDIFSSADELRIAYRTIDPDDIDCSNQAEDPPNFCSSNTKLTGTSGVLSSPNFPNNYGEMEDCVWSIIAPQGYRVQFILHWLGIEDHRYSRPRTCGDDKVTVTEDRGVGYSKGVADLCGCKGLLTHVSYNEKMWMMFTSYKKANWPGFYATYQALTPEECPAGETNCSIKNMDPVGFNAQGQVCTSLVKTSSQVISSATSSLIVSSVESVGKTSSQQVLQSSKQVAEPSGTSSVVPSTIRSSAKTGIHVLETGTLVRSPSETPLVASSYVESTDRKSMQTRETGPPIPSSSGTPFAASSDVELSDRKSMQTQETGPPISSSPGTPFLETSYVRSASVKKSRLVLETSAPEALPSETSSSSLVVFSVKPAKEGSQALETSTLVTMPLETPFVGSRYLEMSATTSSQELKTSIQGRAPLEQSSSHPTADKSMAKTNSITTEDKTAVNPSEFVESESRHSVISTPSKIRGKSATMTTTKQMQTQAIIPSSIVTSTSTKRDLDYISTTPLSVLHASSLRASDRESATDSFSYSTKQTHHAEQATSSLKRRQSTDGFSGSFVRIEDRQTVAPVAQIKTSRNSSVSVKTETIKPSVPTAEPFQNGTLEKGATKLEEEAMATDFKSDVIKSSIFPVSYIKDTSMPGETIVEETSTTTDLQTVALKPSGPASIKSYGTLVVKGTRPIATKSSSALPDDKIPQSDHVSPASQSERVKPSKAGEKASQSSSFGIKTTPVEDTTTKEPSVINREPRDNDTGAIEGKDSSLKGIAVKCTYYAMEVIISRILQPYLVINSLHLMDPTCKVFFSNDTHAVLRAPLESCDTQQKTSEDYFVYVNTMMGDTKSSSSSAVITRKSRIKFEFQCSYRRIHVLSIVSYSPRQKLVRTSEGDGVGNFTFEMDMYKDPKYDVMVNQYPVNVHPGQNMYFQVHVESRDRRLVAFLEECWVTPTPNPRDQTRYTIIEHGCSRDSTLQYVYEKSATQNFAFQAFQFRHESSSRLYVHCEVVTCRSSDTSSVCEAGCTENRRRRRENKPYKMDKDVSLSLGPVNFQERSPAESYVSILYIQVLTGVLAVLAFILLIAVVILILRRRKNERNTWMLLASREQRELLEDEKQTSAKLIPQTTEL